MSTNTFSTANSDAPMSEAPSVGGAGVGVLAPRRSAHDVMGWSADQEQFFISELNFAINFTVSVNFP